jgi:hypothetical protein
VSFAAITSCTSSEGVLMLFVLSAFHDFLVLEPCIGVKFASDSGTLNQKHMRCSKHLLVTMLGGEHRLSRHFRDLDLGKLWLNAVSAGCPSTSCTDENMFKAKLSRRLTK